MKKVFIFSLFLCSISLLFNCKNQSPQHSEKAKACIENIIATDEKIGKIRNHDCEQRPLSLTVNSYVRGLESLDYSDCPKDFTSAFKKHITAWKAVVPITNKYPGLRGEMHDVFEIIENGKDSTEFKALVAEIWATWAEVEAAMK